MVILFCHSARETLDDPATANRKFGICDPRIIALNTSGSCDDLSARGCDVLYYTASLQTLPTVLTPLWAFLLPELRNSIILRMEHRCRACTVVTGDHTPY
ncbi:hypothetical protein AVEN_166093-1 [Araneus ventricosus]|uniref:Uncharacterized protein n=1 Tax=Araneus ventricosus TaxID=182803 RepID=A0A4Y2FSK8_ARAVE|nr:hypothetical protein AVEN_166093-1 [Araneus ventricosus]